MNTDYVIYNLVAMGVFYFSYRYCFSKLTFFQLNRWLILAGVILITVFPWLSTPVANSVGLSQVATVARLDEILILPTSGVADFMMDYWTALAVLYLLGVGIALLRIGVGVAEVMRVVHGSTADFGFGLPVLRSKEVPMAFSFFGWIVLPRQLDSNSAHHVVRHEMVHLRQHHTIDRLIAEVICAISWFNPFVWLMRSELVKVHEFIADSEAMKTSERIGYQESLFNLSVGDSSLAAIASNTFSNPSITKTRFDMMNKKRTRTNGVLRYALLLPIVAFLMIGSVVTVKDSVAQEKKEVKQQVEVMPEFPGGKGALINYMIEHIKYPEDAEKQGVEGKVIVAFVVGPKGEIKDVKVKRKVHPSLDKQAIKVVSGMPAWSPGMDRGKAVNVEMVLPIVYKLSDEEKKEKPASKG